MKQYLDFYIEFADLYKIGEELMASEKQIGLALWRAMKRTQTAIRAKARKELTKTLGLRRAKEIRNRLKRTRVSGSRSKQQCGVWVGLNDMPSYWFKGKPKQTAKGVSFHGMHFPGAFVSPSRKTPGKYRIRKRKGKDRFPTEEVLMPVSGKMLDYLDILVDQDGEKLFWDNFKRDLKARVKYNIGAK